MVKHDGPTLARVSRTNAGRKRGVFTKAWSEGFSSRTVVETWGGGKGLSPSRHEGTETVKFRKR